MSSGLDAQSSRFWPRFRFGLVNEKYNVLKMISVDVIQNGSVGVTLAIVMGNTVQQGYWSSQNTERKLSVLTMSVGDAVLSGAFGN